MQYFPTQGGEDQTTDARTPPVKRSYLKCVGRKKRKEKEEGSRATTTRTLEDCMRLLFGFGQWLTYFLQAPFHLTFSKISVVFKNKLQIQFNSKKKKNGGQSEEEEIERDLSGSSSTFVDAEEFTRLLEEGKVNPKQLAWEEGKKTKKHKRKLPPKSQKKTKGKRPPQKKRKQ